MPVTFEDIRRVIDGSKIEIGQKYPFDEKVRWFVRQPSDWLYDNAVAVREAIEAQVREEPEIVAIERLKPSKDWMDRQNMARDLAQQRVKELEEKGKKRLPEESVELDKQRDYLNRLIDPSTYTRADEVVAKRGKKAFESWLLPRLIVDENDRPIFDMGRAEGQALWDALGMQLKTELRLPFYQAIDLIFTAKNFLSGQNGN